jgi:hypothetical protein
MANDPRRRGRPRRTPEGHPAVAGGVIPPEAEGRRDAPKVIDPARTSRMRMPDGELFEWPGAELLETAAASLALADADRAREEEAIRRAVARIEPLPL